MISPMNRALDTAYRDAYYRVQRNAEWRRFRVGDANPVDDVDDWVWVTAHNPQSRVLSDEENRQRHAQLCRYATDRGWRFWPADSGSDAGDWPVETGLMIADISWAEADKLMRRFDQAAVLVMENGVVSLRSAKCF